MPRPKLQPHGDEALAAAKPARGSKAAAARGGEPAATTKPSRTSKGASSTSKGASSPGPARNKSSKGTKKHSNEDYDDSSLSKNWQLVPTDLPPGEWAAIAPEETELLRLRILYLGGLVVPPVPTRGRPTKELEEGWIKVIRALVGRGLSDPHKIAQLTGVKVDTITGWIQKAHELEGVPGLGPGGQPYMRGRLLLQALEDAEFARSKARLLADLDPKGAASMLKAADQADRRVMALLGLDKATMPAEAPPDGQERELTPEETLEQLGVADPSGLLRRIGKLGAQSLSLPTVERRDDET